MTTSPDRSFTQRLLEPCKPIHGRLKPHEAWLRGLAALAVAYAAILTAVARTAAPGQPNWTAGHGALIGALAAVMLILAYAAFEVLDDHFTDQAAAEAEQLKDQLDELQTKLDRAREDSKRRHRKRDLDRDVNGFCRTIVSHIHTALPDIHAHDVAAHVWLCDDKTELFVRRWSFHLSEKRGTSGVTWGKGKGVVGWAWKSGEPLTIALEDLYRKYDRGKAPFGKLGERDRFGMNYAEVTRTKEHGYTGIVARLIYAERSTPVAVLGLDYSGDAARFAAVAKIMKDTFVRGVLGSCESRLTDADRHNMLWSSDDDRTNDDG